MSYLDSLPENISLQIFENDQVIFQSKGKWLYPLFEFENFLQKQNKHPQNLSSHDTVIGKGAAALAIKFGITKINANLISQNALNLINNYNSQNNNIIQVTYSSLVPKIQCATEDLLENIFDIQQIYLFLKDRINNLN